MFSKKFLIRLMLVVLPAQGPPVRTTRWIRFLSTVKNIPQVCENKSFKIDWPTLDWRWTWGQKYGRVDWQTLIDLLIRKLLWVGRFFGEHEEAIQAWLEYGLVAQGAVSHFLFGHWFRHTAAVHLNRIHSTWSLSCQSNSLNIHFFLVVFVYDQNIYKKI